MKIFYKISYIIILFLYSVQLSLCYNFETDEIANPDLYITPPNIANCSEGALKESEKQKILAYVNKIRAIHGLKPVTYDYAGDEAAMKGAMVCAANANIQHDIPPSWQCYSEKAKYGTLNSNLYIQWMGAPNYPQSEVSILSWMYDLNQPELGHRRAIINPFLASISFGRSDGTPKVQSSYKYVTTMSLKYLDNLNQKISDTDIEFVAYPHNNYPPNLFNKNWLLSFSAIYDKNNWWNNQNVDYSNAVIEVTDPQNRKMNVHSISFDNQGWGGLMNCLKWKVDGLQDGITYTVKISNIRVNNVAKSYTYWFNLQDSGGQNPPGQVVLSEPANNSINQPTDLTLKWNSLINATSYRLQLAENENFIPAILEMNVGNTTTYGLTNLKASTKYYWRVAAENSYGSGPWSATWNFTTQQQAAQMPGLILPPDNEIMVSLTPTFIWTSTKDASAYQLQVATNSNFLAQTLIINEQNINNTKFKLSTASKLAENRTYYWRVRQSQPNEGKWSEVFMFTTKPANAFGPNLIYPLEGESSLTTKPQFKWGSIPGAKKYQLQISKDPDLLPNQLHLNKIISYDTTYKIDENEILEYETIYYWQVRSIEPEFSPWSEVSFFRTGNITSVEHILPNHEEPILIIKPNPFSTDAKIELITSQGGHIDLALYNQLGQKITTLYSGTIEQGLHHFQIDSREMTSGTYILKLKGNEIIKSILIQHIK